MTFPSYGYQLGPSTCWSYGCVKCQTRHYEYEPIFEQHKYHESKHGHEIVPIPTTNPSR